MAAERICEAAKMQHICLFFLFVFVLLSSEVTSFTVKDVSAKSSEGILAH